MSVAVIVSSSIRYLFVGNKLCGWLCEKCSTIVCIVYFITSSALLPALVRQYGNIVKLITYTKTYSIAGD